LFVLYILEVFGINQIQDESNINKLTRDITKMTSYIFFITKQSLKQCIHVQWYEQFRLFKNTL